MQSQLKYYQLLAEKYPTCQSVYTELINLEAYSCLPCATEHFMSDIHGELDAFTHILNNCSGVIRDLVNDMYADSMTDSERDEFCTLIYYPDAHLHTLRSKKRLTALWYDQNLKNLINLARCLADRYTSHHVRKMLPEDYGYIIDELLHVSLGKESAHHDYHERIVDSIIATGAADDFIRSVTHVIKRCAVTKLHIVGDVYDRGQRADRVMDELMMHGNVDIQWGNHDAAWMGAAAGSEVCMAQVVRTCIHYDSLSILESSYGISLRRLATFAASTYKKEPGTTRMEKAINVIMFKLVEQAIQRHPNWGMQERCLLGNIKSDQGVVTIGGVDYPLKTCDFPTLDPEDPSRLSEGERHIMDGFVTAFAESDRLQRHVFFLYEKGSVYKVSNGRLLFHGCVPLNPDGTFTAVMSGGIKRSGKEYLDYVDRMARRAYLARDQRALDWMWYLWCGYHSPLAGRTMKTFERTYVSDKSLWDEPQDPYFDLIRDEEVCKRVLAEFGLTSDDSFIVNGHTPVHEKDGDSPVRANGHVFVIDGGFCRAYHKTTGIAGYTLIAEDKGVILKAHRPFTSVLDAINSNDDIASAHQEFVRDYHDKPRTVADTDKGKRILKQIDDLSELLFYYRSGAISERGTDSLDIPLYDTYLYL